MRKLLAFLIPLMLFATADAQVNPLKVIQKKLSNGMTVWINEDHSQPKVYGAVIVKAGAKDCPNTGMAHYFEHIMFKGTDKIGTIDYAKEKPWLDSISAKYDILAKTKDAIQRTTIQKDINRLSIKAGEYAIPNEFSSLITAFGGTGLNAFTSFDETVFHNSFSPQYIRQWCKLNSDRLMSPVFRLFQGELETVYEEKNMYSDNMLMAPAEYAESKVFAGTPYAYSIIGSTENLKNPRLSEMKKFYNKYYVADNMTLILTGDVNADSISDILENTFGHIRSGNVEKELPFKLQPLKDLGTMKLKLPIPIIKAGGIVYRAPIDRDSDYNAFTVALGLLNNSSETGFLDSLRNDNKVMYAIAMMSPFKETNVVGIGFVPNIPFGSRKKAEKMCLEQIEKLKKGDFSDELLYSTKLLLEKKAQKDLENIDNRATIMTTAASHCLSWDKVLNEGKGIAAVSREDIMRVAAKYFSDDCVRAIKTFGHYPKDKISQPGYSPIKPKHAGEQSEYAKEIKAMPTQDIKPKLIDFHKDANTIILAPKTRLYTVKNPSNDLFELELIYHRGTDNDNRIADVADYIGSIGTEKHTKNEFAKAMLKLGSSYNVYANRNRFTITLSGFDNNLSASVKLLRELLDCAKAEKKKFKDIIKDKKLSEKTAFKDNANIADIMGQKIIYGNNSIYMKRCSAKDYKNTKPQDFINLFKDIQNYDLSIVYSGKLDDNEVEKMIKQELPIDRSRLDYEPVNYKLETYSTPTVYIYNNPKARQTVISSYVNIPKMPTEEDRARLELWGNYFGSGMSSVLFQEIREFRAYAYYSHGNTLTSPLPHYSSYPTGFASRMGVQADKSMAALEVLDSSYKNMPLRENNITAAKQSEINSINNRYPDFRSMGQTIDSYIMKGYTADPSTAATSIIPLLGFDDCKKFYDDYIKNKPIIYYIVGNMKTINRDALAKYGKVIEIKKEDIFHK
jgi:predicted Zn-dependent peptidase